MASENALHDANRVPSLLAESSVTPGETKRLKVNADGRLLVAATGGGGASLTVTDGVTTVNNVDEITFAGASVTDDGSGDVTVTVSAAAGGSNTQLQYNNAGSLAGITGATTNGTVVTLTSPVLVTPSLGVATATSLNGLTVTASTGTLTIANGKTLTASNTLTFTGTDGSSVAFGTGGTVLYATSTLPLTVGNTTIASGTDTRVLYDNAGVLGEYAISGTGSVAMTNGPTFVTPTLGVASATSVNKVAITAPATGATLTLTDGKTLAVTNTLTLSGTDSTVMTFPSTSASIARTDAGQTFTGVQVFTSPDVATSLTTPSTTFALLNATATTVNAFGAATTINVGTSATVLNFGGGATAAEFRFLEPSGSGTNYTAFKAVAQSANITYSLPPTVGAAGTVLTDVAGNGVLTWEAGGGGGLSWGASISGTTPDGVTLTVSNSASANVTGLNVTVGNTQSNADVGGAEIDIGTSGAAYGLRIVGTGSTATTDEDKHLVLWGNTASNANKVLSVGNGTSFTETAWMRADGRLALFPAASSNVLNVNGGNNTNDVVSTFTGGTGNFSSYLLHGVTASSSGSFTNRTNPYVQLSLSRTNTATSGTVVDNYNFASFIRTSVQNGSGGTLTAAGSVGYFENVATQTAGTLTDSVVVLKLVQDADSTGVPLEITQNAVVSTNFKKVITAGGATIWTSDGTTPNGALSGTAGDICLNGTGGQTFYCTGTTNWTGM